MLHEQDAIMGGNRNTELFVILLKDMRIRFRRRYRNDRRDVLMTRTETTEFLGELLVATRLGGAGSHWASEVSIDPWTSNAKRVDYMQFCPASQCSVSGIEKGIFTCYEIKSCKEDVYSGNGLNFLGEKNYIVTTMECYKDILPDFRSGRFANFMAEKHPDSSAYFGVIVAIPSLREATEEFENPTPLDKDKDWKLDVILPCRQGLRTKSMTELLFCMLRSGRGGLR